MTFPKFKNQTQESLSADKLNFWIFLFAIISILAQASLILSASGRLPPQVPLFYSRPWGEAMLAAPLALWILPAICAFVGLVNFSISIFLISNNRFLSRILFIVSFIVSLTTLYNTIKIISLLI
jgi:hypothetical protein